MEINLTKNILCSVDIPIKQSSEIYDKWYDSISDFMFEYLKNKEVSFLSYDVPGKSIGDDFCEDNYKIKTYNNTFYYYKSASLSKENIGLLVRDPEFYLGTIILINGIYNPEEADLIARCWEKELITSNKEIFKMDSDGYCFYCYNMNSKSFEDSFQNFLASVNS